MLLFLPSGAAYACVGQPNRNEKRLRWEAPSKLIKRRSRDDGQRRLGYLNQARLRLKAEGKRQKAKGKRSDVASCSCTNFVTVMRQRTDSGMHGCRKRIEHS